MTVLDRFSLLGKVAVVTGAGGGLGRTFALGLAEAGADVLGFDNEATSLEETVHQIQGKGFQALGVVGDVADAEQIEVMVGRLMDWRGHADVLVNNAGIATVPGRTHEISISDWDRAFAINLRGVFMCTRALLPGMLQRDTASIVNISSFLGLVGAYPGFAITAVPYASTKAGLIGFTRQLAMEYAAEGIRVNAIAPGWHGGTKLGRERPAAANAGQVERFEAFIRSSVPMGRRGAPDDLVGLLLYLASSASNYVTGQVFVHDGGLTAA